MACNQYVIKMKGSKVPLARAKNQLTLIDKLRKKLKEKGTFQIYRVCRAKEELVNEINL